MERPLNGLEYLEELRKRNGKQIQTFTSLSHYLDKRAREKGIPICGQFELTPLCNFSCKMCYVHLEKKQLSDRKVMAVEQWKNLMYQAFEAGMMHVTLTGGECLAYPGFDEIYNYLRGLGCTVTVLTNGYFLDDKRIDFFKEHIPALIQITLYGSNDDVYERVTGQRAFGVVKQNIDKAIQVGLPVKISITPSVYLGEDVFETIKVAKSMTENFTVSSKLFAPREETGRSNQRDEGDIGYYIRIYKFLNALSGREMPEIEDEKLPPVGGESHECEQCGLLCGGGRSGFVVDWQGTLMPCNRLSVVKAFPLKVGFKKAWEEVNQVAKNWPQVPECQGCAYRTVCHDCAANMLQYAEPGKQPLGLCEQTKNYVKHGIVHIPECE